MNWIETSVNEKKEILNLVSQNGYLHLLEQAGTELVDVLKAGNRILLAGNGGSAADAQHFAGEMVGRFTMERKALPAIALSTDSSVASCIANDYGYEEIFVRQLQGLGQKGDLLIAISTSGNSENLIKALEAAKELGLRTIGLLGKGGGCMKDLCDHALIVPSQNTPRIQEVHTWTVHLLCEYVERQLFHSKAV